METMFLDSFLAILFYSDYKARFAFETFTSGHTPCKIPNITFSTLKYYVPRILLPINIDRYMHQVTIYGFFFKINPVCPLACCKSPPESQ